MTSEAKDPGPTVAVIIPCFNEAASIEKTVRDLATALPRARIYVYDNNSTDGTAEIARRAGATVRFEKRQGKGFVVRRAFADVDADIFLLIDGDDTYEAASAPELISTLQEGPYDHVVGVRRHTSKTAYRPGHQWGNRVLTWLVAVLFGRSMTDVLSGYRVMSRRYVKSFPALSPEFEIETEMTIHSLHLGVPIAEVPVNFRDRSQDSDSKLRTVRDGWRILWWIVRVTQRERPIAFHSVLAIGIFLVAVVLAIPIISEYLRTGLVPRFPTAFLAAAISTIAVLVFAMGYILSAISHGRHEMARLLYLRIPAPNTPDDSLEAQLAAVAAEVPVGRRGTAHG